MTLTNYELPNRFTFFFGVRGRYSLETVTPGKTVKVKVEKNTALVIDNQGLDQVSVELYVIGDTGLSM